MSKPHLLIVTPSYVPEGTGAAQYYQELVAEPQEKFAVSMLSTMTAKSDLSHFRLYARIPAIIRSFVLFRLLLLPISTFFWISLLRFVRRVNLLQVHSSTAMTLGAVLASAVYRMPITYDVQDMQAPRWLLRFGYKPKYIAVGDMVQQQLQDAGVDSKDMLTITSVAPSIGLHEKPERDPRQLVFVGSLLRKAKGLGLLVKAMRGLASTNTDCMLHIIGSGKDGKWLAKEIRTDLWLASHVKLRGTLPHQETMREIARAQALILPSQSEAVPRVIIEAFALGTPVIATRVGSIPQLIGENVRGILIPPEDSAALEQAMYTMLRSTDETRAQSEAAQTYADALPTWSSLRAKIFNFSVRQ